MAILDFNQIPQANISTGDQDTFELFARDFFEYLHYRIVSVPNRGADGGKDILIEETRTGVGGETKIKWLVSCKHKAHSGKSVTPNDEGDIRDRVDAHHCQGFIGFYSTLPSSGLTTKLDGLSSKLEVQVFDYAKIEKRLLGSSKGIKLAERYFPKSIENWKAENPKPAKIFSEPPTLNCEYCGKNLLDPKNNGIVVFWSKFSDDINDKEWIEDAYWSCKGHCDDALSSSRRDKHLIDSWEDIPDVMIPTVYIKWIMSIVNQLRFGIHYSETAFDKLKHFLCSLFPYVTRDLTSTENEQLQSLMRLPAFLGGMGY